VIRPELPTNAAEDCALKDISNNPINNRTLNRKKSEQRPIELNYGTTTKQLARNLGNNSGEGALFVHD
jgi:hypothetical protein